MMDQQSQTQLAQVCESCGQWTGLQTSSEQASQTDVASELKHLEGRQELQSAEAQQQVEQVLQVSALTSVFETAIQFSPHRQRSMPLINHSYIQ